MSALASDIFNFNFDVWDSLDRESMELTQTSEFWTQVHYEAERLELVPPADQEPLESDEDWRIMDTQEELEEHKDNIVHHDCMWAGKCADSLHPNNTFVPETDEAAPAPGTSLLRREPSPARPETPPSLDGDEPPQFRHTVDITGTALRLLRDSAAVAADHSYTLARQQFDCLGVQTPSDSCESEEEIDVVSVGTVSAPLTAVHARIESLPRECLPRTPSAQQRQQLQRTVAASMAPRPAGRKRLVPPPAVASPPRRRTRGPGRRGRRSNTDSDSEAEAPEIERRSIHNDMERMRRIGLKNLFDELKKQIPATRDKERAPKVVILREAASLCRKLRQEELEREYLKKQQTRLVKQLKKLRVAMAGRYRPY